MSIFKEVENISLDEKDICDLFEPEGYFAQNLKDFEYRSEQMEMLKQVLSGLKNNLFSLIEAGTGTGKTLAYLFPLLLWSIVKEKKVLISTHTIALQEQILHKEFPFLQKQLGVDVKACLIKGMNNYVCLRKIEEGRREGWAYKSQELEAIADWSEGTREGSLSDLDFVPAVNTWNQVNVDTDQCLFKKCSYYDQCFFFKAREKAKYADILVVNHHLLCTDVCRRYDEGEEPVGVLPDYSSVVIDEAHHLEEVASVHLSQGFSSPEIFYLLGKLSDKRQDSKIFKIRKLLAKKSNSSDQSSVDSLWKLIDESLPLCRQSLLLSYQEWLEDLELCCNEVSNQYKSRHNNEVKIRLCEEVLTSWDLETKFLLSENQRLINILDEMEHLVEQWKDESWQWAVLEIRSLNKRLLQQTQAIKSFFLLEGNEKNIRWITIKSLPSQTSVFGVIAPLDLSRHLPQRLFDPFSSMVFTSATLSTQENFLFFKERLGLNSQKERLQEKVFSSPFDYARQALFATVSNLPFPDQFDFEERASTLLEDILLSSRGGAFVLFTSYKSLQSFHNRLKSSLEDKGLVCFKQGNSPREKLLEEFKKKGNGVLFGTDSFWEGVDVVGKSLRCVIIMKLPFKVPSEPLNQGRCEEMRKAGKDPFFSYSLPEAILKFKQGFGRLLRHKEDRGVVICLDTRLVKKGYGRHFLKSLPANLQTFTDEEALLSNLGNFFNKSY
jgi:ATP-dependent DNA helicase DinG